MEKQRKFHEGGISKLGFLWNRTVHSFSRATIINWHGLGGLHSRYLLSHSVGGWRIEMRASAGLVSSEAALLGLKMVLFSLCLRIIFPLCVCPDLFL